MSGVGEPERTTQKRVVKLFESDLGYDYLGDWKDRPDNANIEVELLTENLRQRGYDDNLINRALDRFKREASVGGGRDLYEANRDVYSLLRYGVKVRPGLGEHTETVWLIDWDNPEANHFAVAEEVTVFGQHTKRPDVVLYVNGIAIGVLELKRSKVAVSEGIRQTIGNQKPEFIRPFFTTVQLVFAGNDVEGLRYAVIDTPEKYWLNWKLTTDMDDATRASIEERSAGIEQPLDRYLAQICDKRRLLEIVHDFIVFDAGVKKTCRPNQYFGVKAAQERIRQREGGIIWHTQGSGKSLSMVWLAKWIRESQAGTNPRVLIITDRTELDEQIEKVFAGVNEAIYRSSSGVDLLGTLNRSDEWLMCSLIHKFRGSDDDAARDAADEDFIRQLKQLPEDFVAKGNFFVFVDEAHRTQSGKMHDAMQSLLPGAMFIGFTGTPLLRSDKETTLEKFGSFIHTYKFDEAVTDGVVLDLLYEPRHIDQQLLSPEKVDKWFDIKTKNMTDLSKAELKKRWGTVQKVTSSASRAAQIVDDILMDMETKPRLMDRRGNAILVSDSIYQACKFYELFCQQGFKGKCAIVTSYVPHAGDISKEDSGQGDTEKLRQYDIYRQMLADYFGEPADSAVNKIDVFEKEVKQRFIDEPGQMRLLIVVDKLLTGFDAPAATYLYIDKKMRDHGLFQAICRVNRLDGDDKRYGYIVDYRDLFNSLERAITDYTSGALDGYAREDIEGLLTDRITKGREDLEEALEQIRLLVEPVAPPKATPQYQAYFCATVPGDAAQIKANEGKRVDLYKAVTNVTRAFAALANDMETAGYSAKETEDIRQEIADYVSIRDEVKLGAGENVDFKQYEAGMRALLDNYILASPSQPLVDLENVGLIDLIVKLGADAIDKLPVGIRKEPEAVAATITNNIRKVIVDEHALNPKYYDKMSALLDAIIEERRRGAIDYQTYLQKLIDQAQQVGRQESDTTYPSWANTGAKRALVDFGLPSEEDAEAVDQAIMDNKPADWVGSTIKEKKVRRAVASVLPEHYERLDELFELIKHRDEYR